MRDQHLNKLLKRNNNKFDNHNLIFPYEIWKRMFVRLNQPRQKNKKNYLLIGHQLGEHTKFKYQRLDKNVILCSIISLWSHYFGFMIYDSWLMLAFCCFGELTTNSN